MKKQSTTPSHSNGTHSKNLFSDLCSKNASVRYRAQRILALIICVPLMVACAAYICHWTWEKHRVEQENASYEALYRPESTPVVTATASPTVTSTAVPATQSPSPTSTPTTVPTAASTAVPATATPVPAATPTAVPETTAPVPTKEAVLTAEPTPSATAQPAITATPIPIPEEEIITDAQESNEGLPVFDIAVDATLVPRSTPNADTIVFALETPPPTQHSFGDLLALNPETVGYLRIGDTISLPVVQRKNDNSYYLNHSFSQEESLAGTLFLDGSNLLVPKDDNLIIYGHNMRNGTMFHALTQYQDPAFLKEHALISFDTIYENRSYVPFAAFSVTVDASDARYLDLRQFVFDPGSFGSFIDEIQALSIYNSPINAIYGDKLLMLVTCEYQHNDGRFIVVLRELRANETAEQMMEQVKNTKIKTAG